MGKMKSFLNCGILLLAVVLGGNTNNGGAFGCTIEGFDKENFQESSLKTNDTTLVFDAVNWSDSEFDLKINFDTTENTYKFMTVNHSNYKDFAISINGTDITSSLKNSN